MVRFPLALAALTVFFGGSAEQLSASSPVLGASLPVPARAWLGVILAADAERVTVLEVIPDSPAATAGLRPGDVLLAVDEASIGSYSDLQRELSQSRAGHEIELSIDRSGNLLALRLRLVETPEMLPRTALASRHRESSLAGPSVETIAAQQDPQAKAYLGISIREVGKGVRIEDVIESSPAANAGLQVGDRLVSIDGQKIGNLRDLSRVMSKLRSGQQVRIEIERGDTSRHLRISMGGSVDRAEPATEVTAEPESIEAEMQAARERIDRERAALAVELDRTRLEIERSLEQAQQEVAQVRARMQEEMHKVQSEIQAERRRASREMARERGRLERELAQAQEQAREGIRRAQMQMTEEREKFARELRRAQHEAEQERQQSRREMAREQAALAEELHHAQHDAEQEMARQRARHEQELILAREEMDRARRQLSRLAPPRVSPTSRSTAGKVGGLRGEIEQIRRELRELKANLQRKRR